MLQLEEVLAGGTDDWIEICPECELTFEERNPSGERGECEGITFPVRRVTSGSFLAAAFFPDDPPHKQVLLIDDSFFSTSFSKQGIIRHELGHILGYRHEHIQGIPGCSKEGGQWEPLTPYDPHSVMHYFCGGAGTRMLEITDLDREGHQRLYGPGDFE